MESGYVLVVAVRGGPGPATATATPAAAGPASAEVTSGEPLIYALVDLTLGLADRTQALITDVLAELDLTQALADVVWQLDPAAPLPSLRALAARLRCDPSTVTFLADRLEGRHLATRRVDPANRRVKTLQLTPRGRRARRRLVDAMATRSPLAQLTPDEQHQLLQLLRRTAPPSNPG